MLVSKHFSLVFEFMKVAVICHLEYPIAQPFAGGLETHTWFLCQSLMTRGHQVTVFASGDSDQRLNLVPLVAKSFALEKAMPAAEKDFKKEIVYQKLLHQINRSDFDLIHNNSLNHIPFLAAQNLRIPMLTVLHTPPFAKLFAAARSVPASAQFRLLAVSQAIAQQWQPVTSEVVYNGIDISQWTFNPHPEPNSALWFGRFVPEKSPHEAILATQLAGFKLKLAGPISDADYFRQKVLPHIDGNRVQYLGHLSHQQLQTVVGQAAVFVNTPSWAEPYGLVYAESLACGTPVAAFESGAVREIVDDTCGCVVPQRCLTRLAAAIHSAAQRSRQQCRLRAEKFCSLETMIDHYEAHYRQLLSALVEPLPEVAGAA